jgi:hypothetical protein
MADGMDAARLERKRRSDIESFATGMETRLRQSGVGYELMSTEGMWQALRNAVEAGDEVSVGIMATGLHIRRLHGER